MLEIQLQRAREPRACTGPARHRRGRRPRAGAPTSLLGEHGRLMIIAADHPARGALRRRRPDPLAMANRGDLLDRICTRAGPPGRQRRARHPGHPRGPAAARRARRQGRDRLDEPRRPGRHRRSRSTTGSPPTTRTASPRPASRAARCCCGSTRTTPAPWPRCESLRAGAVSDLAGHRLMAMVEPFISHRVDGRVRNELTAEAMIRAMTVAAGLGTTSRLHLAEGAGRRRTWNG